MRDLHADVRRFHGLATRSQLQSLGHTARALRAAVVSGEVTRIGRSWLASSHAPAAARRAIELRGILGGESALESYGVWLSHRTGLCISTPTTASRLPALRPGEYRLWRDDLPHGDVRWRVTVEAALIQHLPRIADPRHAIASIDSAMNRRLLTAEGRDRVMRRMPRRIRRLRRRLDGSAQSGLETLLRLAILDEGWSVESQVEIPGVGRVDLLIDGWLVIEADGSRWHDGHEAVALDRKRNTALVLRGYRWHRFGHEQVMQDLGTCVAVIRALLAAGRP